MADKELELLRKLGSCYDKDQMARAIEELEAARAQGEKLKVYVILYQDLWLNTCKVSQEGYKTLSEAVNFCKSRMGVQSWADIPAIYHSQSSEGKWVFGNSATKQQYTIVEVTV